MTYAFLVTVIDIQPPTFDFIPTQEYELGSITEMDWTTLIQNASDNASGDLIFAVELNNVDFTAAGVYRVRVSVTDQAGNIKTQSFNVLIVDTIGPIVILNPSIDTLPLNATYIEQDVTVIDAAQVLRVIKGSVDTSIPGTYVIEYIVSDGVNDLVIVKRYITVYDPNPSIRFELGEALTTIHVGDDYVDGICQVYVNDTVDDCQVKEDNVNVAVSGIYTITYSYQYEGQEYTYQRYVFVIGDDAVLVTTATFKKEEGEEA
jgi:hypothetical protein